MDKLFIYLNAICSAILPGNPNSYWLFASEAPNKLFCVGVDSPSGHRCRLAIISRAVDHTSPSSIGHPRPHRRSEVTVWNCTCNQHLLSPYSSTRQHDVEMSATIQQTLENWLTNKSPSAMRRCQHLGLISPTNTLMLHKKHQHVHTTHKLKHTQQMNNKTSNASKQQN